MKGIYLQILIGVAVMLTAAHFLPALSPGAVSYAAEPTPTDVVIFLPFITNGNISSGSPFWKPAPKTSWQWQLDGTLDTSVDVQMYDIDMFDNDAGVVESLHAQGRKVVCYINVGSWENWRPDADLFPAEVIGNDYDGWPGEKWLDIRQLDVIGPIMQSRLDECKARGFDSVEPDNMDSYMSDTGFPLTYQDQLTYNVWLANESHARGLSIGMKNNDEQIEDLLPYYDWALTEGCFVEGWCDDLHPFVDAGKAVFVAEYSDTDISMDSLCDYAEQMNYNAICKNRELDAWLETCP